MSSKNLRDAESIFAEACEKSPPERAEFLDEACGSDAELRSRVDQLVTTWSLHAGTYSSPSAITAISPGERGNDESDPADVHRLRAFRGDEVPDQIGPYRVVRRVDEGGMGVVYEGRQDEPVRRRVAIKLVKWGMDTRDVISRFESERQALALMSHPAIASVYDAGATADGRPYFAMEFVQGIPISWYCDKHRLSINERLELFIQVCDGVQHAHQKGIIHRDIKPSNILVSVPGKRPLPKIIDFGVAKAISQRLTEHSVYTELGQLIGTPEYMSPEQAEMTNLDIDTRTDVYSLGVLLYELLVGKQPFESTTLRQAGLFEIQRRLREEEPPRPSTKVRSDAATLGDSARNRRLDVKSLEKTLEGDLDWIVMKAMEKDRTRRYETANAFALDIQRFLDDEPVRARAPSATYRVSKFVRRNRVTVVAAAAVAISLVFGSFVATLGMVRARHAERLATAEAAKANAINDFMQQALGAANPQEGIGRDTTVLDALASATSEIQTSFEAQPEVEAAVRSNIGLTYIRLGRYDEAGPLIESALAMQETFYGREHLEVAETLTRLSTLRFEEGEHAEAEASMREALSIRRRLLGEDHLLVAEGLDNLGLSVSYGQGDYEAAEQLHREALAIRVAQLDEADEMVIRNMSNLGMVLYRQQKHDEAEELFRRSIELNRRLGRADLNLTLYNNLGLLLRDIGRYEEASAALTEVISGTRDLFGEKHPEVASRLNNLGALQVRMGEFAKAEATHRESLALAQKAFGEEHFVTATTKSLLAAALMEQQRLEEAESLLLEAHRDIRRDFSDDHPRTQATIRRLARLYEQWGKPESAQRYQELLK